MTSDVPNQTLRALRRILRATEMGSKQLAASTGLTPSQLLVLREINEANQSTPSAIAHALQFSQATITSVVDRLVAAGLAARQRSEKDKRQILLHITDDGRFALVNAPDSLQMQFQHRFGALALWEQAMILASLEKLSEVLGAQNIEAAPLLDSGPIDRTAPD